MQPQPPQSCERSQTAAESYTATHRDVVTVTAAGVAMVDALDESPDDGDRYTPN